MIARILTVTLITLAHLLVFSVCPMIAFGMFVLLTLIMFLGVRDGLDQIENKVRNK